jgi:hypothetical protein
MSADERHCAALISSPLPIQSVPLSFELCGELFILAGGSQLGVVW